MEDFYAELKATGKISSTDFFYVTGYSLGGHLATAFNLLRQEAGEAERIVHTYTFNGAGTRKLCSAGRNSKAFSVTSANGGAILPAFPGARSLPLTANTSSAKPPAESKRFSTSRHGSRA